MATNEDNIPQSDVTTGETPKLGFGAKLWNLFVDPRKTFSSVGQSHEWVILWILVSLISIGAYMPVKDIIKHDEIARVEDQLRQRQDLTQEQRDQASEMVRSQLDNPFWLFVSLVFYLIAIVAVSGVLLFMGNIILGGNTSYLRMLNAYAWITIVATPDSRGGLEGIVKAPIIMAKESTDVSLGLGVLATPETGAFTTTVLSSFELFGLWQVWLSAVAVAVLANVETKKAFWSVFVAWLIWVVIQGGLAAIGAQFGM